MKKVLLLALAGLVATGMIACKKESDGKITLNPASLTFEYGDEAKTVTVSGKNWKILPGYEEWITVEKQSGKLIVTVDDYSGLSQRQGSVTIANGDDSKTLTVIQRGADPNINVTPDDLEFTYTGGDSEKKTVNVTAEAEWDATTEDEWLHIEKAADGLSFTVTADLWGGVESREGSIVVDNGATQKPITVTQGAATLNVAEAVEFLFGDGVDEKTVAVESDLEWTLNPKSTWIKVTKSGDSFIVKPDANNSGGPREGYIDVSNGNGGLRTIAVIQADLPQTYTADRIAVRRWTGYFAVTLISGPNNTPENRQLVMNIAFPQGDPRAEDVPAGIYTGIPNNEGTGVNLVDSNHKTGIPAAVKGYTEARVIYEGGKGGATITARVAFPADPANPAGAQEAWVMTFTGTYSVRL